jgi:hypothetical protein
VRRDNTAIRKDDANIGYQETEGGQDDAVVNKDMRRLGAEQKKLKEELAERDVDRRHEDAQIEEGDFKTRMPKRLAVKRKTVKSVT